MPGSGADLEPRRWWLPAPLLGALVAVPLLLTRPGQVVIGGDVDLLADPGAAVRRGLRSWDAELGLGAVSGGEVRRIWPLGAYHWLADAARVPDWIAQRLVVVLAVVAAAAGVLHLARAWRWRASAAATAATLYALSPFLVTGGLDGDRLLPYAGAPWLLGLTVEGLRRRGWRHPVLFGLTAATVGASSAVLAVVLLAPPLAWVAHARWSSHEVGRARAISTLTKAGLALVVLSAWWVAALSVEATNGLDVGRAAAPPEVVNATSSGSEVLRGMGRWEEYAPSSVEAAAAYTQRPLLLVASFLVPVLAVLGLGVSRWRHRSFTIGLVAVATVLAVGAHPPGDPSPVGALLRAVERTDPGSALRGLQEATVLVSLGTALAVGSLVAALAEDQRRRAVAAAIAAVAIGAAVVTPLWAGEVVPADRARDDLISTDVRAVADALDAGDDRLRVLELPGVDAARDPTPLALALDRPHVVRTARPRGSEASADLLRALDSRIQQGTLAPEALAPIARLLGVGDVVVRADESPAAAALLGEAPGFGGVRRRGDLVWARVEDPLTPTRAHTGEQQVLLSGSGDGIVDAAAAGLLDGDELIRYSSTITADDDFVRTHLRDERTIVVTDTARARAQRWTALSGGDGFTEAVDGGVLADDPFDLRFGPPVEVGSGRTVVDPGAVRVQASAYGEPDRYRPDLRPALAADGDPATAWSIPADDATGQRLRITTTEPVDAGAVRIHQVTSAGAPPIDRIEVRVDRQDGRTIELDERSLRAPGQPVDLGGGELTTLDLTIRSLAEPADDAGTGAMVGIAEVDLGGPTVDQVVRMPSDLLDAAGFRSTRYPLALVQTRLRPTTPGADPEERTLQRVVDLPATRAYQLRGTARPAADADVPTDGTCRSDLVAVDGEPVPVRLAPGVAGALRVEGCEAATIPGGERRFTTAAPEDTGVHVDQLVWTSDPVLGVTPAPVPPAPEVDARWVDDATVDVSFASVTPGEPFWLVLGQSFDPGWAAVDVAGVEVASPELVDGYANGFLVTPADPDPAIELRFVPQNRVDVALLVSAVGAALALALLWTRSGEVRVPPAPLHEPLRRLRAFTYEGALPTRHDARVIAAVGGVGGFLLAGPLVGVALALVGGFATRREGWRPLLTLLPVGLLLAAAGSVVLEQLEERHPHAIDWPLATGLLHEAAVAAVLLLALDAVIERSWRRGSLLEDRPSARHR